MLKNKVLSTGVSLLLLCSVLVGCGSAAESETETATTTAAESTSVDESTTETSQNSDEAAKDMAQGGRLDFKQDTSNNVPATYSDVAYASESDSQVCNIYIPDTDEDSDGTYPTIILVHGGGFAMETQNEVLIQPVIETALENGYAVVSVDYRKSSEATFPAALADVKAAVRWIRANAEEYGFDTDNLTIWGESAGAYLAAMTALTPDVEELNGDVTENLNYSSEVNCLVDFYGPIEFYTMDEEFEALGMSEDANHSDESSFESAFLGQALDKDEETTYETYWETYVDELPDDFTLKAWIQAGTEDENVPYTQSENFAERLSAVIGEENVSFSLIDGAGHMDEAFYTDENLEAVFEFIEE